MQNSFFYTLIVLFFVSLFPLSSTVWGQNCNFVIKGTITDKGTGEPLAFVNVVLQEQNKGTISEEDGSFVIEGVCKGDNHLIFSHIGCDPVEHFLHLHENVDIPIQLAHTSLELDEVEVNSTSTHPHNESTQVIRKETIEDNMDENLSGLLENETGVYALKNGNGIAKPIVHGMFGNRLAILNNGVPQSGQQWGNDHAPEIDPLIANKITVVKGTSVLEYAGGNMGGLILVEPQPLSVAHSHLHGQLGYVYETNGRGHNVNAQLQKNATFAAWKVNGTFKRYGDRKTATYYLNNTGSQEANLAFQLEKMWKNKYALHLYASTFNTQLGVLKGSHIGNLTDLEQALEKDVPFFTEPNFSYKIEPPRQKVGHHLLKINAKYYPNERESLNFIFSAQLNDRKEYDVRRGGRSHIPVMNLIQYTFASDLKYNKELSNQWSFKAGNQNIFTDNTNQRTGILPLIPDYLSWKIGVFGVLDKQWEHSFLSFGGRYDYEYRNVVVQENYPRRLVTYTNHYHNASFNAGYTQQIAKQHTLIFNTGYTMRNPAINELYSQGLHQGVSGIEEGEINLQPEHSLKTTLEYKWQIGTKIALGTLLYYQNIEDYIYLNPQDQFRLTIRGAFPVFKYEQTDAEIYGLDISTQISLTPSLIATLKYSYLRGNDKSQNQPLVNMPPQVFMGSLVYRLNHIIHLGKKIKMDDLEIECNNRYVFQQKHLNPEQDFALPPDAYYLLGFKASANVMVAQRKVRVFAKASNVLNAKYRDYLNRQRYFANDLGMSINVGFNVKF